MRVTLVLPGALLALTSGQTRLRLEVHEGTVASVLEALGEVHPAVYDRLMTERRELRPHVNVFVGTENTAWTGGLDTPVKEGGEVFVLPSVSGGSGGSEPA